MLLTNLLAYGGDVWLVTVTAPGTPEFHRSQGESEAWVERWALPRDDPSRAAAWNASAPQHWSELHRRAQQAVRRSGVVVSLLAYVWQVQRRGVLHLHLMLGVGTPPERVAARKYVGELRARSRPHGFGFIDAVDRDGKSGRSRVMAPERAAGYVSPYLTESVQLMAALELRERPARLVWVSPRLTRVTGCIRRRLRRARFLWHIRNGTSVLAQAGRLPRWLRDETEHAAVARLLRTPVLAGAP